MTKFYDPDIGYTQNDLIDNLYVEHFIAVGQYHNGKRPKIYDTYAMEVFNSVNRAFEGTSNREAMIHVARQYGWI